jgi:hypothetical protein
MQFQLQKSGTLTDCREALNAVVHSLPVPETQEHKVIRAIANAVVVDEIDPQHTDWQRDVQKARAVDLPEPPEPRTSFDISCSIKYGA